MGVKYANAAGILPPELLKEVQKYHLGALWIPSPGRFYAERRELVLALHKQKFSAKEIAPLAGVSLRRINQILQRDRQKNGDSGK